MEAFIRSRGKELSLVAVDADIIHYKVVARFMKGGGRNGKVLASLASFPGTGRQTAGVGKRRVEAGQSGI